MVANLYVSCIVVIVGCVACSTSFRTISEAPPTKNDYSGHIDNARRSGSEVVIIRSAKTDGCWDASCGVSINHHPFVNAAACDWSIKLFQWWFAGPTLRTYDCNGKQQCLVCYDGTPTCNVETDKCTGNSDQRWFLSAFGHGSHKYGQQRFSIQSEKYPGNCVTMYDVLGEGSIHLKLQPCTAPPALEQSFYIDSDGFATIKKAQEQKQLTIANQGESGDSSQPLENFNCKTKGKHADPFDCKTFHECIPKLLSSNYKDNEFYHYRLICSEGTVYCQDSQACDWEYKCPCKK